MNKKVLYIINGLGFSENQAIGGSDKRAVEIIRNLKKQNPNDVYDILTTDSGYKLCNVDENLKTKYILIKRPNLWPNHLLNNLFGRAISYFYTMFASLFKANKVKDYDIYYATSDFFFDIIPGYFFKLINQKKLVCILHHHIKNPFKRKGSLIVNIFLYTSQIFSINIIRFIADEILVYATQEGEQLKRILKRNAIFIKNGINNELIDSALPGEKLYDAVFLGGIRKSKGIDDFIPIWKSVVKKMPSAKLLIIGGGSKELVKQLQDNIKKEDLEKNIILVGPKKSDKNLFELIKSSKVFLFPSYEEGWGIALCEAMYCNLPVVCYKLPAFATFGTELDSYEIGDKEALAQKTLFYLENPKKTLEKGNSLRKIAKQYTWNEVAKEENVILNNLIANK